MPSLSLACYSSCLPSSGRPPTSRSLETARVGQPPSSGDLADRWDLGISRVKMLTSFWLGPYRWHFRPNAWHGHHRPRHLHRCHPLFVPVREGSSSGMAMQSAMPRPAIGLTIHYACDWVKELPVILAPFIEWTSSCLRGCFRRRCHPLRLAASAGTDHLNRVTISASSSTTPFFPPLLGICLPSA